jgi:HrpA-like RNA helicase
MGVQKQLEENTVPEIQRTNMTSTVLLLKHSILKSDKWSLGAVA